VSEIAYLNLCCVKRLFDDATSERIMQVRVEVVMPDQVPLETGGAPS
jgi:hypothetical protein